MKTTCLQGTVARPSLPEQPHRREYTPEPEKRAAAGNTTAGGTTKDEEFTD